MEDCGVKDPHNVCGVKCITIRFLYSIKIKNVYKYIYNIHLKDRNKILVHNFQSLNILHTQYKVCLF